MELKVDNSVGEEKTAVMVRGVGALIQLKG